MFNEKGCLENLKRIVSEHADDENIKNLSMDELRSSYMEIADNIYSISVSNRLKYKNMLWNIDNLKPEIRSKFQTELFNTWHSIYIKSAKTDPTKDRPEIKKQESIPAVEAEKRVESSEDTDISLKKGPAIAQSSITSAHKFENDWFDKLLDFFAAIVGGVSRIVGR